MQNAPQSPRVIFAEDFENTGTTPVLLNHYTGAPPLNMTYTAANAWLTNCNGWILSNQSSSTYAPLVNSCAPTAATAIANLKAMAAALGPVTGQPSATNHVVAAYTQADPGANHIQFKTNSTIPLPSPNRFIAFAVGAAEANCDNNHAKMNFALLQGTQVIPLTANPIDPCNQGTQLATSPNVFGGSFTSDGSTLVSSSSAGIQMTNAQGSGSGNDAAFDDVRMLDTTPHVEKSFQSPDVPTGGSVRLTFTVYNTTELNAKPGWSFTDDLPSGLTVASPADTSTTCTNGEVGATPGSGTLTLSGNLDAGQDSCTLSVQVTSPVPGSFSNCPANVTNLIGMDPPTVCTQTTFSNRANVRITKTGPGTVTEGGTVAYELDVSNEGPDDAADVMVEDVLSAHLTGIRVPPECNLAGRTVTCHLGTLAAGTGHVIRIEADVAPGVAAGTNIENCGTVSSTTPQVTDADKSSCTITTVTPAPTNVSITKTGTPQVAVPGGPVTYKLTVTNHGPGAAHDTVVTDMLPRELTGFTVPADCTLEGHTLTCTVGTLAAGTARTFTVTATVAADTTEGMTIQDCADVLTSTPETDYEDNSDCAETIVGTAPPATNVSITKLAPATAIQGHAVRYTLTVVNHGTVAAHHVVVTDVFPGEVTVTGVPHRCTLVGRTLTCPVGTIAAGATRTFMVKARVSAQAAAGLVIEDCAAVESTTRDSHLGNNKSCAATTVKRRPVTDVAITKTGPATAPPGGQINYLLTVTNRSRVTAHATVVSDVFPDELTITGVPRGCMLAGRTLICPVGPLAAGASAAFTVTATVHQVPGGSAIGNCAVVYTATTETRLASNASCAQVIVRVPPSPFPMPKGPAPTGETALTGLDRPLTGAGLALAVLGGLVGASSARRRARRAPGLTERG